MVIMIIIIIIHIIHIIHIILLGAWLTMHKFIILVPLEAG